MKVFINGKEIAITLEGETKLIEIIEPIEKMCNDGGLLISKTAINGEFAEIDNIESLDISSVDTFHIEALSYSEHALETLSSIREYIITVSDTINGSITDDDINSITNGIDWILDALPQIIFLLNMKLETHSVMHIIKTLEVKKENILNLKTDYDELKKFLENDIKPFLKEKMLDTINLIISDGEVNAISMLTVDINKENALYRIGALNVFLPIINNIIDEIVLNLQKGNDKEAFLLSEKFSRAVSSTFTVISFVLNIYDIDIADVKKDGIALKDKTDIFNIIINNIIEAFKNEDYISIADLLEYEVKDETVNIFDYIPIIEKEIENKNV